jgi:hypothetical protein
MMTKEEKLDKVTRDFSALPEEKQDYILCVLQALAYAYHTVDGQTEAVLGSEQNPRADRILKNFVK